MRQEALKQRLKGDTAFQGKTAKTGKGQYVELQREGTDKVFVVLVEFGDAQYPRDGTTRSSGPAADGSTTDVTGPLHNQIPAARPQRRQQHPVAARLRRGALREHVLHPDGELLRGPVVEPLLGQRATSTAG